MRNVTPDYESALVYFNETMNHLPVDFNRRAVPLQANAAPSVNLRRLCFGLSNNPDALVLLKPDPCSFQDLLLPHESHQGQGTEDPPSFIQGAKQEIARTDAQVTAEVAARLVQEEDETEFFFELIFVSGTL